METALSRAEGPPAVARFAPDFRTIYEAEFSYVLRSLRRLGVPSRDVEDLVHEVFFVVHRQLAVYDPTRPLRPWLFGIAFRVASDYLRRACNSREIIGEPHEPAGTGADPEEELHARRARDVVVTALGRLDLDKRVVFVMHDLDGHPMREIAEVLAVSANTLYSRLHAAREQFTTLVREATGAGGAG